MSTIVLKQQSHEPLVEPQKDPEIVDQVPPVTNVQEFPDGGYGWVQVAASFMIHFVVIGMINVYGVYQEAYKKEVIFAGQSNTVIAFVGSLTAGGLTLFGTPSGRFADRFGYGLMCGIGSLLIIVSLVLASFSTAFWHILLTQGFMFGFACSITYFPGLSIISHWFSKRKGLAAGIAMSGSGLGGFALGPLTRFLISKLGWQWSLRITGLAGGVILFACALVLRTRLPPSSKGSMNIIELLKDSRFFRFFASGIFNSFGYFIPFFFVSVYATQQGLSPTQGALLVGILNGASGIGRIILGILADRFGHALMLGICLNVASGSILFIWPFAHDFGMLICFTVVYGFSAGGYISLVPTTVSSLFGTKDIASLTGLIFTGASVGNFAGPACFAALNEAFTTPGQPLNYLPGMIMSGLSVLVGSTLIVSVLVWKGR